MIEDCWRDARTEVDGFEFNYAQSQPQPFRDYSSVQGKSTREINKPIPIFLPVATPNVYETSTMGEDFSMTFIRFITGDGKRSGYTGLVIHHPGIG